MNTASEIIRRAQTSGVTLAVTPAGGLAVSALAAPPAELRDAIRENKAAIIAALSAPSAAPDLRSLACSCTAARRFDGQPLPPACVGCSEL